METIFNEYKQPISLSFYCVCFLPETYDDMVGCDNCYKYHYSTINYKQVNKNTGDVKIVVHGLKDKRLNSISKCTDRLQYWFSAVNNIQFFRSFYQCTL